MTFIDARTLRPGHRIEADLCIIGSGAAGLAIAKHFFGSNEKVAILESGGEELDLATQRLCTGQSIGQRHARLEASRLRYFGGSTNHWTAHLRTLDPIDFEQRDWVPHSGWPIALDDLAPYYEKARVFLGLPEQPFDIAKWRKPGLGPWAFEDERIQSRLRQVLPARLRRLGPAIRNEMAGSSNVDTYLYANVLNIELSEGRQQVRRLDVSTLARTRLTAHARAFVLATGGIENPRILQLSEIGTSPDPRKDLVGRYFANHPATDIAEIQLDSQTPGANYYKGMWRDSWRTLPLLVLSSATQRKFKVLNTWLSVNKRLRHPEEIPRRDRKLDMLVSILVNEMDRLGRREEGAKKNLPGKKMVLRAIFEQAPNPESRILLGDAKDHFGQRQAVLDWQFTELDTTSVREVIKIVTREMGIAGLGRVRSLFPEGGLPALDTRGAYHHMGTTRMHTDPTRGVVDRDCRFHGVSNLYVAGSSVFPTTGMSNPTYTILALAFRLAEHLKEKE